MGKIFPANLNRYDPYKAYRFLVYFGKSTTPVAAVSRVGAINRTSDVIEYNEGGNAVVLKGLGRTRYDPITLERGVTQDTDFATWANYAQVLDHGAPSTSLANLRREVAIVLLNEEAQPVLRYLVHRCWVSQFQALPELDAGGNTIAIESIRMENEGWERDLTLAEPVEQ
jgi:phage tail-like protein